MPHVSAAGTYKTASYSALLSLSHKYCFQLRLSWILIGKLVTKTKRQKALRFHWSSIVTTNQSKDYFYIVRMTSDLERHFSQKQCLLFFVAVKTQHSPLQFFSVLVLNQKLKLASLRFYLGIFYYTLIHYYTLKM